jgi:hypothetical protein
MRESGHIAKCDTVKVALKFYSSSSNIMQTYALTKKCNMPKRKRHKLQMTSYCTVMV